MGTNSCPRAAVYGTVRLSVRVRVSSADCGVRRSSLVTFTILMRGTVFRCLHFTAGATTAVVQPVG